jgi:phosphoribosylaminoimidazole-succinocarboxamide synthase
MKLIGKGKAKDIYETEDNEILFDYTERVTAFDGLKKANFATKGIVCCRLSQFWFSRFADAGIQHAFIGCPSDHEMKQKKVEILPVEVILRNYLTGSLWKRFNEGAAQLPEGTEEKEGAVIPGGYVEFTTKFEAVDRPITREEVKENGWMTAEEITYLEDTTRKVNAHLRSYLEEKGILLVDFKIEYGRRDGVILLADEVGTPDVCRFWDLEEFKKGNIVRLDKDVFRKGTADLGDTYNEIFERITGESI